MTLNECIAYMPDNQLICIRVMTVEMYRGDKAIFMNQPPKWINDTVVNMSSNATHLIIDLKDSMHTRKELCIKILDNSPILNSYFKMYKCLHYDKILKEIDSLLTEIRGDK